MVEMPWLQAKTACEQKGGYLACAETLEENEFLAGLKGDKVVWLGGYLEASGTWKWLSGASVDRSRFGPLGHGARDTNVAFSKGDEYSLRPPDGKKAALVNHVQGFICEWDE